VLEKAGGGRVCGAGGTHHKGEQETGGRGEKPKQRLGGRAVGRVGIAKLQGGAMETERTNRTGRREGQNRRARRGGGARAPRMGEGGELRWVHTHAQ